MPPPAPTCSAAVSSNGLAISVTYTTPISASLPALFAEIWRLDTTTGIAVRLATNLLVTSGLSLGLIFADYHTTHGVGYQYFCRVYATDGSSADSPKTSSTTLTLTRGCLSDTLNPSAFNASLYNVQMQDAQDWIPLSPTSGAGGGSTGAIGSASPPWLSEFKNTTAPSAYLGAIKHRTFMVQGIIPVSELPTQYANLLAIYALQDTLCYRDPSGNKVFCVLPPLDLKYFNQNAHGIEFSLQLYEVYYSEADQKQPVLNPATGQLWGDSNVWAEGLFDA